MMGMCGKCKKATGLMLLAAGVLFLLKDVGIWTFWSLNWYTVAFIVFGVAKVASASCADCEACGTAKPKKK